jgi:hypothetical protein
MKLWKAFQEHYYGLEIGFGTGEGDSWLDFWIYHENGYRIEHGLTLKFGPFVVWFGISWELR